MIYTQFKEYKLSMLGFGTMRLPQTEDGKIDRKAFAEMTAEAIEAGVNYFDTAWPYHNGESEIALGEVIKAYPRESIYIADKFPGHQPADRYDCEGIFNMQQNKCGVDYFDFYLLHNVGEFSYDTYMNRDNGIVEYFIEQRRTGRIKHLGFSTHATPTLLEKFLDTPYGKEMEFCQIQLNYLDWTLQDAKRKCDILKKHGIPVWVMEPVRGGKLASLPESMELTELKASHPGESDAALAFRWLQRIPEVAMVLSGMSDIDQMRDNLKTFSSPAPLSDKEAATIEKIADSLQNVIPCTACRYCCGGCPAGLDIPQLIASCNDLRFQSTFNVTMLLDSLPEDKKPTACQNCGACTRICPQGIDVPATMKELCERYAAAPKWAEICRQREEAAKKYYAK